MKVRNILFTAALVVFCSCSANAVIVKTGIEVLRDNKFDILDGKRVGLITNPTGVDRNLKSTIDILHEAKNVELVALFAPEHGVRGDIHAGDKVETFVDSATGVTVYSIYKKPYKPSAEMLKNIDVLVYDIQDIGCRSYTFISTMGLAMEAAAEHNIPFVVLDRPNPVGGLKIEGNYVEEGYFSFVSQFKIPYLYAQTCGELAIMLNEENMLAKKCDLKVVKMEGWERSMTWEDTGLEWVLASPHIPHKHSGLFYPITGILGELGYVSIGVGYTLPFQIVGAPWIEAPKFAKAMNALNLAGLHFRPIYFKPFYSTFKGENCQGVEIHITDYNKVKLAEVQFYIMQVMNDLYPDKAVFANANEKRYNMFDKVSGSNYIRTEFAKNHKFSDIADYWYKDVEDYRKISSKYYLYE